MIHVKHIYRDRTDSGLDAFFSDFFFQFWILTHIGGFECAMLGRIDSFSNMANFCINSNSILIENQLQTIDYNVFSSAMD